MMDWQKLGETLGQELGLRADRLDVQSVSGGDINRAYRLKLGAERFFVKTNRAGLLPMFEAERIGLAAIARTGSIRVPQVFLCGSRDGQAYIVMEFIDFGGRARPEQLARSLAAMHGCCNQRFGFDVDNTIGSTPQPNQYRDDWIEFWSEQRLGFQLRLAAANGFDSGLIDAGQRLLEVLESFFVDYRPRASLLHGDLWGGNQAYDLAGCPVIFDPACYYGDHEADLAMMELFGHPGETFFAAYRELFPIDAGYARRRELYNLYHVLNHANLFGGGYAAQARRMIESLLAS